MTKYSPEQAVDALKRYPQLCEKDTPLLRYLLALRDGTLPAYYFSTLHEYRFNRRDDLPSIDVRTLLEERGKHIFKCQGNTVLGITLSLSGLVEEGIVVQPELIQEIQEFVRSDLNFQVGDPENPAKIERINTILDKTLGYLGQTYNIDQAAL
jgi:hypothetical protein